MNVVENQLSSTELGERLRVARETAKITQASAAASLEVARTTVVAIEAGQRRPRLDELQKLAGIYGTSVNALLRREAVQVDLKPRFRKAGEQGHGIDEAVGLLTTLVQAEVELENLLGVQRVRNDPPERPLLPGDIALQAEQDAGELRQWLGLGLSPVHDIFALLELNLGARVYARRLPPNISGLYAYDDVAGACILLNASHPRERRAQTAAHEIGHFIGTRRAPDALRDDCPENSREERYANTFARAFLTPARPVMSKFRDVTAGSTTFTRRHVIILAHAFGVSREAMVRRLEELKLIKAGTWDFFAANGGITDEHVRQVLGDAAPFGENRADQYRPVSLRLSTLAGEAHRLGLLSEGQLARLLQIDRVDVRQILDEQDADGKESDDLLKLGA